MSRRLNAAVLLFAISIAGCGKIEETLDGTWVGQTVGFSKMPRFHEIWTFKDGTISVATPHRPNDVAWLMNYKIDATKEPKQIDMTIRRPSGEEELRLGIYKIEKDTLTLCHLSPKRAKADATRPESFEDTGRDDVVLVTFQRQKDAPKKKSEVPLEGQ